jgi:hypothetical protein
MLAACAELRGVHPLSVGNRALTAIAIVRSEVVGLVMGVS